MSYAMDLLANDEGPTIDPDEHGCHFCGGPLEVMGVLGRTAHLRCQNCGGMENMPAEDLEQIIEAGWTE